LNYADTDNRKGVFASRVTQAKSSHRIMDKIEKIMIFDIEVDVH